MPGSRHPLVDGALTAPAPATHIDGLAGHKVVLEHAAQALGDGRHITEVELVEELDGAGQEVVHHLKQGGGRGGERGEGRA